MNDLTTVTNAITHAVGLIAASIGGIALVSFVIQVLRGATKHVY